MTSKRVDSLTEMRGGQWINKTSLFYDGICSKPRMVVSVSGQRVYHTNRQGENEGDYCSTSSVAFVSDSKPEADALYSVSESQERSIREATKKRRTEHDALIDSLLKGDAA